MKKVFVAAGMLVLFSTAATHANETGREIVSEVSVSEAPAFVGSFTAEGQSIDVKFVRVLYAGEGSEKEGESNALDQLVFDSVDPNGNTVKVLRYQIVAKNTGYDEVQTSLEEDFKLKSVKNGAKLHIEVPVVNGQPQLDKAYVGNLAYNFGTRETRHNLTAETVSDIKFDLQQLDLPVFGAGHKPGDKGLIYNDGYIKFEFSAKAKHIASDDVSDFIIRVDAPISVTHVRGKERSRFAVSIDEGVVQKNVR